MKNEQQFSNLIYEYFLMRIRCQYYRHGDTLPSIETLCQEFNVAPLTVTAALRRLREEGYLTMHNGRPTTVIYKPSSEQELSSFILRYFSERKHAFSDLCESAELFFVPMHVEGLRRMNEVELACLYRLTERADPDDLVHFFSFTLQKIENPLAMNLFWEVSLFQGFPFAKMCPPSDCYDADVARMRMREIIEEAKAGNWEAVRRAFILYERIDAGIVDADLERCAQPLAKEERVPFVWRIYWDRPQVCYNLAGRILHEIYLGEYRGQRFLPSYEILAKKYGVSVSTMRRTIGMVSQIGAVRPINGKGTRIFSIGERSDEPDFTSPAIRRNLSFFVQSFELILYSCEGVTHALFQNIAPETKKELLEQLEENLRTGLSELSLWHYLIFISTYSQLDAIKEIYSRIYSLFLWGYPLKACLEQTEELDRALEEFTKAMIQHLKADDVEGCARAVKALVSDHFSDGETHLLSHGIRPEELRLSPSIRLLITSEGSGT